MTGRRPADERRRRPATAGADRASGDRERTSVGSDAGRRAGRRDTEAARRAQRRFGNQTVGRVLGQRPSGPETGRSDKSASADGSAPVTTSDPHREGISRTPLPSRSFDALGDGRPLPAETRSVMEASFGTALGAVRLHTAGPGVALASAMDVPAFAVGRDVVVRPGQVDPASRSGLSTLAHEVTHVLQQGARGSGTGRTAAEREAATAADAVSRGEPAGVTTSTGLRVAPQGYTGSHAVSPEELFEILRSWRGHTLSGGAATVTPKVLADAERLGSDVPGSQQELGPGYKTTAVVAISDAEGRHLIDVGAGVSDSDAHAEVKAIDDLRTSIERRGLAQQVRGGHVMVVVDQSVCTGCRMQLASFAEEYGLATVRAHTFSRGKLRGSGQASPKTSMRGTTRRYFTPQPPLRQQLDWQFVNPAFSGPDGTAGQRQTELFLDPERRSSGGSESGGVADRQSGTTGEAPRQRTLFDHAREMSRRSDVDVSPPPTELAPGVRFVRFLGHISDILAVYDGVMTFVEAMDMATGLAADRTVFLKQTASALRAQDDRIQSHLDRYEAYSEDLRALEPTLVDVANSNDLDAIWATELDVGRLETDIHGHQSRLEFSVLPELKATKRAVIDKRQQIEAAMRNRSFVSLLGIGGSTVPHSKLVAFRQDLIKLTGILSGTIGSVERTIEQMERDREYLLTWRDWLGQEYVRTLWDLEAQEDADE